MAILELVDQPAAPAAKATEAARRSARTPRSPSPAQGTGRSSRPRPRPRPRSRAGRTTPNRTPSPSRPSLKNPSPSRPSLKKPRSLRSPNPTRRTGSLDRPPPPRRLRRHEFRRLPGPARSADRAGRARRRARASSPCDDNRARPRLPDAPTPAFTRSVRWSASTSSRPRCRTSSCARCRRCCRHDVAVLDAQPAPSDFDARLSASWRSYVYLLWCCEAPNPLYSQVLAVGPRPRRHVRLLAEALRIDRRHARLHSFGRVRRRPDARPPHHRGDGRRRRSVRPDPHHRESFLHQMVRSLVGTALEIATGRKAAGLDARRARSARPLRRRPRRSPARAHAHGCRLQRDVDWPRRRPQIAVAVVGSRASSHAERRYA